MISEQASTQRIERKESLATTMWMIEDREEMAYVIRLMIEVSFPGITVKEFRDGESAVKALQSGGVPMPSMVTVDGDLGRNKQTGPQIIEALGKELNAKKATTYFVAMSGVDELNDEMFRVAQDIGQPVQVVGKGPEANTKLLALLEEIEKGGESKKSEE
ncbi:MAG: hypothetical protein WC246_02100 [Candidatus Paceibacterota bacterium]|jgi:hypothetical protein